MGLSNVIQITAYVFGRPVGDYRPEFSDALTSAMALADDFDENLITFRRTELDCVWDRAVIEKIRGKRRRCHGRGSLPGTTEAADVVPARSRSS